MKVVSMLDYWKDLRDTFAAGALVQRRIGDLTNASRYEGIARMQAYGTAIGYDALRFTSTGSGNIGVSRAVWITSVAETREVRAAKAVHSGSCFWLRPLVL